MPRESKSSVPGPRQGDFDCEPVFRLLKSYFNGDRALAIAEVSPIMEGGRSLKEACEIVIASHGFERSFY